jgi:hypothetical protein
MFTTSCFLAVVFAAGPPSLGAPADEKQLLETKSQATVRLKLNVIESAKLLERYEKLLQREIDLQENVKACNKSGDPRLPEYEDALKDAQEALETTKKKLLDLEMEKARLIERLGKKDSGDASSEQIEKLNRTLEKILERLTGIEKRLERK